MSAPKKGDLSAREKELFEVISAGKLLVLIPASSCCCWLENVSVWVSAEALDSPEMILIRV